MAWLTAALLALGLCCVTAASQPHIIFILADDLGYNDVSWHNRDILSPRLGQLAAEGVILEQSYVQPICSPSRSALMAGRYAFHLGRQHGVLTALQPTGLTLNHTLLPEVLRTAGYRTHMVGKWHLGNCAPEYLPQSRGFETFLGYWGGQEDYTTHQEMGGLDFWEGNRSAPELMGQYSAELYGQRAEEIIQAHDASEPLFLYLPFQNVHAPLQVPDEYSDRYPDVKNPERRVFSGMVSALDDAVGRVVDALKAADLYDNSVIVFVSDNGGQPHDSGNNFPLRGTKGTVWEGGCRTPAFVHSPLLQKTGYVSSALVHISDWLPTLAGLAGAVDTDTSRDGVDQWAAISTGAPSAREELVYNIDNAAGGFSAALRIGDLKLVWGDNSKNSDWYPVPESEGPATADFAVADIDFSVGEPFLAPHGDLGDPHGPAYLFNVTADPGEHEDLSTQMPEALQQLQDRVVELMKGLVPADTPPNDPAGMPWFGVLTTGWCEPH